MTGRYVGVRDSFPGNEGTSGNQGTSGNHGEHHFESFFAGPVRIPSGAPDQPTSRDQFSSGTPNRRRRVVPAVLVVVLVASVASLELRPTPGAARAATSADGAITFAKARPAVRDFANPTRLLPAVAGPAGVGGYAALLTRNAAPVTWDPCQPIHFVVRPDGAIPSGRVMLDQVLNEVSEATGLLFIDDGATTEVPGATHDPYQPDRYGKTWAPVLIAWSNEVEDPALAGDVVGYGGPEATSIAGQGERIVSGTVVFDAPNLTEQLAEPDGGVQVEDVMRHELGHLVGLDHVNDPSQLMNPVEVGGVKDYGVGDLRGLAAMGAGRCFSNG